MDKDLRFRETSKHTTDDKGRIVLPTRFREVVDASGHDQIVISQMERALVGYTLQDWQVVEEKIMSMPVESNAFRDLKRFFLGAAQKCECNRQGRVLIPATCLSAAVFMVACDILSRVIFPPLEIPIGVITAILGAPTFMFLLKRGARAK